MKDVEICPICRKVYSPRNPRVQYHLQYRPTGEYIYACRLCNYAEHLSRPRNWKGWYKPWIWSRIKLTREFAKANPHLTY